MREQYATFYLGSGLFAVNVLLVQEINRNLEITEVDPSPEYVVGLMNLRGQIVTILDLGVRLGIGKIGRTQDSCCIILKTNETIGRMNLREELKGRTAEGFVGLLVDSVAEMVEVEESDIEKPPANVNGVEGTYLRGGMKRDAKLAALVDMQRILQVV